jgi:hypothetical protein
MSPLPFPVPSAPPPPGPQAHLLGSATSASVTAQGSGGTHSCTAGEKGDVLMSFSISSTSCISGTEQYATGDTAQKCYSQDAGS